MVLATRGHTPPRSSLPAAGEALLDKELEKSSSPYCAAQKLEDLGQVISPSLDLLHFPLNEEMGNDLLGSLLALEYCDCRDCFRR